MGVRELAPWIKRSSAESTDFLSVCHTFFEEADLHGVLGPFWGWLIALPAFLRSLGVFSRPKASNRETGRALGLQKRLEGPN